MKQNIVKIFDSKYAHILFYFILFYFPKFISNHYNTSILLLSLSLLAALLFGLISYLIRNNKLIWIIFFILFLFFYSYYLLFFLGFIWLFIPVPENFGRFEL